MSQCGETSFVAIPWVNFLPSAVALPHFDQRFKQPFGRHSVVFLCISSYITTRTYLAIHTSTCIRTKVGICQHSRAVIYHFLPEARGGCNYICGGESCAGTWQKRTLTVVLPDRKSGKLQNFENSCCHALATSSRHRRTTSLSFWSITVAEVAASRESDTHKRSRNMIAQTQ